MNNQNRRTKCIIDLCYLVVKNLEGKIVSQALKIMKSSRASIRR